jgi:DNA primase
VGISQDTIEQVRAASDIVDVIGGYIPLKRAGANFMALCPFHREKTPSFNVNPTRQFYHCFGCHKGGDVFAFVRDYENIDFLDAVRRLAERARIPIETEAQPGGAEARHVKDRLLQLHEQIAARWQTALTSDPGAGVARDYLAKRGVPAEAVELFRIGYAPDAWDDTVNWAKSKHYETSLVEQAGLVVRKEGSDHYYDRFRGRLMFPICDEQGRVIGFSGRILSGDEKVAKYVNSPETPIFTKGKVMFGLDKSKRAILETHSAVICEGQLDLIACFMAGVKNVVAPQGTALTGDHARILKRYAEEVVLCFDSDNAGQKAAVRSLDSLLACGLNIRVAMVPAPHDPDSFIKENGGPAFEGLIRKAQGFFDYYLDRLCATNDLSTDKGRRLVVREMGEAVRKTGSAILLDTYTQKTAARLGVSAQAVRSDFGKSRVAASGAEEPEQDAETEALPKPPLQECWLLRLLLETDELVDWIFKRLDLQWIGDPAAREIIAARLRGHEEGNWPGLAAWLSQTGNAQWQSLITELLVDAQPVHDAELILKGSPTRPGAIKIIRDKHADKQLAALQQRLSAPDLSLEAMQEIERQKKSLRELKRAPLE